MPVTNLPLKDHVLRHVPWARLRKDADMNVLGCLPSAFELRPGESHLSVTWLEHFQGESPARLAAAIEAMRQDQEIRKKARIAQGNVGAVHDACAEHEAKVRIVHEATAKNPGHSGIHQLPMKNDLLDLLAAEVFAELFISLDYPPAAGWQQPKKLPEG